MENNTNKTRGLAVASMVLGIIAMVLSFIPIINAISYILGILAIIFGLIILFSKGKKGMAIQGVVLSIISIIITTSVISSVSKGVKEFSDNINGNNTEKILKNDIDVTLGKFTAEDQGFGIFSTKLDIKVKNKLKEKKSFWITVEAIDSQKTRILTDMVIINGLDSNQTFEDTIFNLVGTDKIEAMKNATFRVIEVIKQ